MIYINVTLLCKHTLGTDMNCLSQIGSLRGYYLLSHHEVHKRSTEPSHEHHRKLNDEPEVSSIFIEISKNISCP